MKTGEVITSCEGYLNTNLSFNEESFGTISSMVSMSKKKFEQTAKMLNETYLTIMSIDNELQGTNEEEKAIVLNGVMKKNKKKVIAQINMLYMYKILHIKLMDVMLAKFRNDVDVNSKDFKKLFIISEKYDISL